MSGTAGIGSEREPKQVKIEVNKQQVVLDGKVATGAQIKAAAIAQGVSTVFPDSRLFVHEDGAWVLVPDDKPVALRDGERFRAQGRQEDA